MNAASEDSHAGLRWGVYLVLIAVAVGNMTGRLLAVNSVDNGPRRHNQERLRELAQRSGADVELFCAHDPVTLERMQSAAAAA